MNCETCKFYDGVYCIEGKFKLHRNKTDGACNYYKEWYNEENKKH